MTRTEADLRDAVSGHPADPEAETRLSAFASGLDNAKPRQLRTWLVPIAAAVAVLIPVTTVLAIRSGQQHSPTASPSVVAGPTAPTTDPSALVDRAWTLINWPGFTGPPGTSGSSDQPAVIKFDGDGGWLFSGFCRNGGGSAKIQPGTLTIDENFFVEGTCAPSSQGSMLRASLEKVTGSSVHWQIRAGDLTITAADGAALVFDSPTGTAPRICGAGDLSVTVDTVERGSGPSTGVQVRLTNESLITCALSGKYPVTVDAARINGTAAPAAGVLEPQTSFVQPFTITGSICTQPVSAGLPGTGYWVVQAEGQEFTPPAPSQFLRFFVNCDEVVPGSPSIQAEPNPGLPPTNTPSTSSPATDAPSTSAPPTSPTESSPSSQPATSSTSTAARTTNAALTPTTSSTPTAALTTNSSLATITGRFTQVGGPPKSDGSTPIFDIAGVISVYTNSAGTGTPIATTKSDSAGNFTLRLQPGTYYLYGTDPNSRQEPGNIPSRIAAAKPVLAHAGGTTTVDITGYVP